MIFRVTVKLGDKLAVAPTQVLPLAENRFADWSAHLFTAERKQYLIVANTKSLYSVLMPARGITNDQLFVERFLECLQADLENDEVGQIFQRILQPNCGQCHFSKPLNPAVTTSLNDLVLRAKLG
ncbi:hypothetical protein ETAA8_14280 [Anatilimnocola aggregata]|uniref:DUF6933 domain-containing protein n=1 Tax=Anatilimnocola aggregata TaxID=2528021 RepID=A0A517Y7Y9_9BACT|nr:hypothetical protein [Anatilimnocola aggregata]QDU26350.1 hypothetical protein ETAA8_14280 [Anatilimnocola aggregata]